MKELKFIGLSLLFFGVASAQDVNEAKKAIDAEQYQKAKTILKSLIASTPDEGKNYFLLGDVYMKQTEQDSASIFFNKGKTVKNNASFNNIGLGQIDLNSGNGTAAQAKFDAIEKELGKRDVEQLIYIGRAYISAQKPDFKKAIAVLNKAIAKDPKSAQAYLSLGDAHYGDRNQSEAYSAYRNAVLYDSSLLRAKLQMAVITKNTRVAFPEAIKAFDAIVASNPNYGPVYRELAETYYIWGATDVSKKAEYNAKALSYYEKYMTLTDYSLDSRMRHADFLLLTGDYKALEAEALKMQQMDKVNPRILRYLAYSLYENGKYTESSAAMKEWIAKADPKRIIARDYMYLGLANLASSVGDDGKGNSTITNQAAFDEAISNIKKAAETDINITNEFGTIAQKLFKQKLYGPAAVVYGVAITNPDNKNLMSDSFFYAYSVYFDHVNKSAEAQKANTENLVKADAALAKVIELSPQAQDAFLYRAKVNRYIQTSESLKVMAEAYDKYIAIVVAKGDAEITKQKKNLIDAYSNAGAFYLVTDKTKATDYFNKALALDPNDEYVKSQLKTLK
jgi:predicted Zn-dependent protease